MASFFPYIPIRVYHSVSKLSKIADIITEAMDFLHQLVEWTTSFAGTPHGLWALFWLAFAESSFFPVPPDLLQIAWSVLEPRQSFLYAALTLAGSLLGAVLGYAIGFFGGRPLLKKLISQEKIQFVEKQFNKYDVWAIGIAGFTPIPYKIFTISGGAFRIPFLRFLVVSFFSRGARFFLVASILYFFGETAKDIVLKNVNLLGIAFVLLLIGGFVFVSFYPKLKREPRKNGLS